MKKKSLLLCLALVSWIPFSIASYKADSTIYPLVTFAADSTKLITITEEQQYTITTKLLEAERCKIIRETQSQLIEKLEERTEMLTGLREACEKVNGQNSIIIQKKDAEISNLEAQIKEHEAIQRALEKKDKKKGKTIKWLKGGLVGAVIVAVIVPTAVAIIKK